LIYVLRPINSSDEAMCVCANEVEEYEMEFLVVVNSLRVIVVGFQAIVGPHEALAASTVMELLFSKEEKEISREFHWCFLFLES
jgi:hypothetical protein